VTNKQEIAIKVDHVSKSFQLPIDQQNTIKGSLVNLFRGVKGYKKQVVLDDINLEIHKGDFFGIVGRNGMGKSTLLKIISKIYTPDSGKVTIHGSLIPFIELGVGFNPELTGRENVYLNGAMLGFTNKQVDKMFDEIVDFDELGEFMDQKLKNYSSGMQVRLAFSMAIRSNPDILLLDEILAVGDEAFQHKSKEYFKRLKKEGKTVILITHSMDQMLQFANRAALINDHKIEMIGDPKKVAKRYKELNKQ
jgi:ABC-2 type transport system ATP-binding protein